MTVLGKTLCFEGVLLILCSYLKQMN